MRSRTSLSVIAIATVVLLAAATAALAQESSPPPDYQQFEQPPISQPLAGYTRGDGTIVLKDEDFCRFLMASVWGDQQLTYSRLIDKSRKQKKARKAAFNPDSDAATLQRCADTLNAFRLELPADDPLAAWARTSPVVPEALAFLLPVDLVNEPLAQPEPIGDGSRTKGYGNHFSAPIALAGGTYFAKVDAPDCASWTGSLRTVRDPSVEVGPVSDQAYLYDVAPANYYWDVTAPGCDWSVDLVPFKLGPEPTATPKPRAVVPKLFGGKWLDHPAAENSNYMNATQARAAILDAGLEVGMCTQERNPPIRPDRVWKQEPIAGSLVDFGSKVNVWIGSDCDILKGDRIEMP